MKRLIGMLAMLGILVGVFFVYPFLTAERVSSDVEAAQLLRTELENGGDNLIFRTADINIDDTYAALEAIYPYAFSMQATGTPRGLTQVRVIVSRQSRQQEAALFAQQLAAETITREMTETEKFRALHDALIRLCAYDSATASSARTTGATAPFAADGALLDHKAVCSGYGRAYSMLCEAAGLTAIYVSSPEMDHGWNAVLVDGKVRYVDCTFDDPIPDRGEVVDETYFLRTGEQLRQTHQWDAMFYESILRG